MIYLDEKALRRTGIDWNRTIDVIEDAVRCMAADDFAQPIKPYLRYRNMKNRIIAMPAFVGGNINMAGIKWIASFPGNIKKGIPRAHSVVVLNDADTGEPVCIITTALLSIIRTASVSGFMLRRFDLVRRPGPLTVGIVGMGPIGQHHLKMVIQLLGDDVQRVNLYDLRPEEEWFPPVQADKIRAVGSWEEAYLDADIFITCTVADVPYINKPPKPGSLHLNVSLRDYTTEAADWFREAIIVDEWEEVCRERTDIQMMHLEKGLQKVDTKSICDMLPDDSLGSYGRDIPILFNPMGMAAFDIALGCYYYQKASQPEIYIC